MSRHLLWAIVRTDGPLQITIVPRLARCQFVAFDGREVRYGFGELDELVLAYATTIRKSQG